MKRQKKDIATVLALENELGHNEDAGISGTRSFTEQGDGEEVNTPRQEADTASTPPAEAPMKSKFLDAPFEPVLYLRPSLQTTGPHWRSESLRR